MTTNAVTLSSYNLFENTDNISLAVTKKLANGTEIYFVNARKHDLINNEFIQAVFGLLYVTIFVLGVFGNVLVCYVVFRNKAMQTVTNLFITNLALSDILLCVLAVPFTPMYTFFRRWIFGTTLCHLVPYAQGCSVYISTLTLTSIAIDRFFVIIYPFHPRMKLSTCVMIIVSIWSFSLLVTLPYGLYVQVVAMSYQGVVSNYCEEHWPSEHYRKVFGSLTSSFQFVLPFLIISFCYICVSCRLNDRAKAKPGSKTTRREECDRDRKKRTNRMLIAMVAVFGISWLPINIVNIFNDFYETTDDWKFYNLLFFIAHSIAMSSTCYNPFLYAWLNENFRKEFKQVLPCYDPSSSRFGYFPSGRAWRTSERNCNGTNETVQESLLPSGVVKPTMPEIIPRGPTQEFGMRTYSSRCIYTNEKTKNGTDISPTTVTTDDKTSIGFYTNGFEPNDVLQDQNQGIDSILLCEVLPPTPATTIQQEHIHHSETIILPSGVLETPFESSNSPVGTTKLKSNKKTPSPTQKTSKNKTNIKNGESPTSRDAFHLILLPVGVEKPVDLAL